MILQIFFFNVILQPSHEQFLHGGSRLGSANVLPGHGSLGFNDPAIDPVRTGVLCVVHHVGSGVGYEAEASRTLRLGVLHDHHIYNFAPLLEVFPERLVCGPVIQTADEEFSELLGLGFVLEVGEYC